MDNSKAVLLILALFFSARSVSAYDVGDRVPLFVNKVGPLNNPRYHFVTVTHKMSRFSLLSKNIFHLAFAHGMFVIQEFEFGLSNIRALTMRLTLLVCKKGKKKRKGNEDPLSFYTYTRHDFTKC